MFVPTYLFWHAHFEIRQWNAGDCQVLTMAIAAEPSMQDQHQKSVGGPVITTA